RSPRSGSCARIGRVSSGGSPLRERLELDVARIEPVRLEVVGVGESEVAVAGGEIAEKRPYDEVLRLEPPRLQQRGARAEVVVEAGERGGPRVVGGHQVAIEVERAGGLP